ncbi:hypothetical protein [Micromonospora sp. KLBMP9576]|uniref:hypothetical protein n=1 Tax=Micromonospora sp. KLBMP9576 TaxID=3424769 RepID=UPI003D94EEA7
MFALEMTPGARGTAVETLYRLVDAVGLVITVQGSGDLEQIVGDIVRAAPRLQEDHEVGASGLITSRVGLYRVVWGALKCPGGSLAVLVPLSGYEGQNTSDWTRHFMHEVLDPIQALSTRGYSVGGGGNGRVTRQDFCQAFKHAHT